MLKRNLQKLDIRRDILFYIFCGVLLFACAIYIKELYHGFLSVLDIIKPVLIGLIFAFIVNVLMRFLEEKILNKIAEKNKVFKKLKRPIAMILSFLIIGAFFSLFIIVVLPQFIVSLSALAKGLPTYADQFTEWLNGILVFYSLDSLAFNDLATYTSEAMNSVSTMLQNTVSNIWGFFTGLANGVLNTIFGLIFAIYMLAGKEKLTRTVSNFSRCFFSETFHQRASYVVRVTDEICSRFIEGQCLDALCLGILSFIVLTIMGMPYALVIAVTLAITNLIPVIGPWLGAIPCAVITFVISPIKALILIITIVILQEVENKLIYPRIVGNRVGIDGIWVLFGVVCGGGLGGLPGIIFGVPVVAVTARLIGDRMEKKGIHTEN